MSATTNTLQVGPSPSPIPTAEQAGSRLRSRAVVGYAGCGLGVGVAVWVIVVSVLRGRVLERAHPEVLLGAAPLVGRDPADGWHWRFGFGLLGAAVVALIVAAAVWSEWFHRARLRTIVASSSFAATCFAFALALTDGADGVLNGARHRSEYLWNLSRTPPAGRFVSTFLQNLDGYSVHVRGHPPGFILVLKFMAAIGLGGAWPVALLSVLATGALVTATLTTVWAVVGPEWVRRCAPFMVVVPYALWQVTSADSVYTAVGALGVAALAVGLRHTGWKAGLAGMVAGLLLGSLLYLTYLGLMFGLVPMMFVMAAAVRRRPGVWMVVAAAVAGVIAVVVGFWLAGFWWFDGVRRTRTEYWEGTAQFRSWSYFRSGNIAVALIAIGPATLVGLMRLRNRKMWLLTGGALAALTASHLSQYTRGEVERIWLLFFPWLVIAAGALAARGARRSAAAWVGLQATCAIVLQAALVSKW
ncbi:MAG: hypothetical protein JWN99_2279 [Ilumatobacteraceae bacterium]|nr:hypothetical protein [Ilumatobacteraceae bacterium]